MVEVQTAEKGRSANILEARDERDATQEGRTGLGQIGAREREGDTLGDADREA